MIDHELLSIHRPSPSVDRHIAIMYLHGGGLLYGDRDDLPHVYVQMLTQAGYTLVCVDYPLAPETTYAGIIKSLLATFRITLARSIAEGEFAGYLLFGRSAGANLALVLARQIAADASLPDPLGIIDFYGYYDLTDSAFYLPAKAYTKLPLVDRQTVQSIVGSSSSLPTSGPKATRFALYIYARQHEGTWLELMGLDGKSSERDARTWSLTDEDITGLQPLFIAASSGDEDVPLRISKMLKRKATSATMKTVYYLPHDFDRDTSKTEGAETYRALIAWIDGIL